MNTHIGHINRYQSRLGGFSPSPKCDSSDASSNRRDDGDASSFGDKMTMSQ